MKHSYLLAGIKANRLASMLIRNKGFSLKYILRILFLLNAALWSNIFNFLEKKRFKKSYNLIHIDNHPIFIVGNWRTGSTFLHQLLALDEQLATPNVYQVANPDHLLVSKKYYAPIMSKALGGKRPMDNVSIGINEPQEDEYALLKLCKNSPLEKLIFSNKQKNFLDDFRNFGQDENGELQDSITTLTKKLSFISGKRILYKNPFHSFRIPQIRANFPQAKFIHIYRNPNKVIYSAKHMWNVVGTQNILKNKWIEPSVDTLSHVYKFIIETIRKESNTMDNKQYAEIKFEEFEQNPVESIKNLYTQLDLKFTKEFETRLSKYCKDLNNYKKNNYTNSDSDNQQIKSIFKNVLPEYYH